MTGYVREGDALANRIAERQAARWKAECVRKDHAMIRTNLFRIAALIFPVLLNAADLQVEWNRVPKDLVEGHKLEVQLTRGGILQGRALSLTPDALRMQISKASPKDSKYGRGEMMVPKGDIAAFKVRKGHIRGRIILPVVTGGIAAGYSAARAITSEGTDVGPELAATSVALVAAGYLLGWLWDRSDVTTIHVLADSHR